MASPPEINIPASASTVNVHIVNTTGTIRAAEVQRFVEPKIPGHDWLACPILSFLIHNPLLNRTIVFDLGVKKDWWNLPPQTVQRFKDTGVTLEVPKSVREVLDEHGVDTKGIEALVWSHTHFDHTGDPSDFESSAALIVGPGCKSEILPGYPADPNTPLSLERYYVGREVHELDFSRSGIKIGKLLAIDYFGDGSFYFLDTPGHCKGHVSGLARVTSNPDSFILMGGDAFHHCGQLRPSQWHPLPDSILPHPFQPLSAAPCPGSLFKDLLRDGEERPFYIPATGSYGQPIYHDDPVEGARTIEKLQEADAHENILVVGAHDQYMLSVADFFPKPANDFMKKGWAKKVRWMFLADFAKAIGYEGKIEAAGDYKP
ncbi:beta-lactamase-like protein [Hypoxylon sp. FL1284]|nr:beta-lactamase-like protein [Hypoxylon sp. FL1284]